jgi:hypothetical protein
MGDDGNDILGGDGDGVTDLLMGGPGWDRFEFDYLNAPVSGVADIIYDFETGIDLIEIPTGPSEFFASATDATSIEEAYAEINDLDTVHFRYNSWMDVGYVVGNINGVPWGLVLLGAGQEGDVMAWDFAFDYDL